MSVAIVQHGSAAENYPNPVTAYVADFIGEANLLSGVFRAGTGDRATATSPLGVLGGRLPETYRPAAGDKVLFSIRPEHVAIGDAVSSLDFNATGTLTEVAYLGGSSRLTIAIGDTTLRADVPGLFTAPAGEAIAFGWRAQDVRILQHDDRFTAPVI